MRILPIALAAALLSGCTRTVHDFAFPDAPDLSAETARPCPALPSVTGELGDLAVKDAGASIEYARCQARAASAVGAYQTLQAQLRAAAAAAAKGGQ